MLLDAWRLAVGTLSALPVRPPRVVDRRRAGIAMVVAPLAVVPLGVVLAGLVVAGRALGLPDLVVAFVAIGATVLGNRAFHLDGLSDTVDGMAASYDRERSLEVMKGGTAGPAGVVALLLVVGVQVAALAALGSRPLGEVAWFSYTPAVAGTPLDGAWPVSATWRGAILAGTALCASRAALAICCARGVAPAREDGLGRTYAQTVPRSVATLVWVLAGALLAVVGAWAGLPWWRGALAGALAAVVVLIVVAKAVRRFGGVTGDVFGAAVELAFATLLVALC